MRLDQIFTEAGAGLIVVLWPIVCSSYPTHCLRYAAHRRTHGKDHLPYEFTGGYSEGVIPVPIPNTVVKPFSADGTWDASPRESRSLPVMFFTNPL